MKTASILLAASMAGAVAAQKLSDYFPECSLSCLEKGTTSATDCSLGDAACFCVQSNYEAIYTTELSCVLKECGSDVSVDKVLPAAVQFCSAAIASASASATGTGKADSTSATTVATTKTTSHAASSEATETAASQTTSSSQSSAAPETTAANSTLVASGRPVTTTSATTSFSTAAAAAAGPMVTAAMLVAGAVALL